MTRTLKQVNAALQNVLGRTADEIELVRGYGYFYFVGTAVKPGGSAAVTVYRLNSLTVDQWVNEALAAIAAAK